MERDDLRAALAAVDDDRVRERAGLAFARGYLALLDGDTEHGLTLLTHALRRARTCDDLLAARIIFEIGAVYVARGRILPADVLLLTAQPSGSDDRADLLHLRALAAESMGDHERAIDLYRRTLSGDSRALSVSTRVLATVNLAASLHRRDPEESLALTDLALMMIDAYALHRRFRPAALNVRGYALICLGRLAAARADLQRAAREACASDHARICLYANFNEAIIDELEGDLDGAARRLEEVAREASEHVPELTGWIDIRQIWLAWLRGDRRHADAQLDRARVGLRSARFTDALAYLGALADAADGRFAEALDTLASLRRSAASRGDAITEAAVLLRMAYIARRVGRVIVGARQAARALDRFRVSSFRASPNWWSREVVSAFVDASNDPVSRALLVPTCGIPTEPSLEAITITGSGDVFRNNQRLVLKWTAGRTGSRVLRRVFGLLISRYPCAIPTEELADIMWPETEGDAAIRNLYAAVHDLRTVLMDLPGVRVIQLGHGYALRLDDVIGLRADARAAPAIR